MSMNILDLIQKTVQIKQTAYAPFSKFRVGAVLVTPDNKLFTGCNIEISSYSLTICAERVAIFKAISEGERKFTEIYIAADSDRFCPPCGACRQVLWELAGNIKIIMINSDNKYEEKMLKNLLPDAFDRNFLEDI